MDKALFFNASQMSNLTILLAYMAMLIVLGAIISLKTTTPSSFMLGSRSFPGWLLAFSIVGTNVSSLAFLAYPAKGYSLDFSVMAAICGAECLSLLFAGIFFVRFLRRTPDASIYTLLGERFGSWASIFASVSFIIASLLRMGVIMYLVAKALHAISGSNVGGVILLCGIIVIFYTYMAGIEGVIWTDLIQTIFLIVAGTICFFFIKNQLPGDLNTLVNALPNAQGESTSSVPIWIAFIYFAVFNCSYFMTDQAIAQRYLSGNSIRAAKNSTFMAALLTPLTLGLFFFIGVALYIFYNSGSGPVLPPEIVTDPDKVFIHFVTQSIPDGLKGLIIVGILSAAMSTIDSGINSSATVFISNIYHPHIKRGLGDAAPSMDVLRRVSLILGALGISIGYFVLISGESALDVFWKWTPVVQVGVFGLFLLMRFSRKIGTYTGAFSITIGALITAWISFTGGKDYAFAAPFHYMLNGPIGILSVIVIGLLLNIILGYKTSASSKEQSIRYNETPGEDCVERPVNTEYHLIKQNALIQALAPNPYYRLLGLGGGLFYILALLGVFSVPLTHQDQILFAIGACTSFVLAAIPRPQQDFQSKKHSLLILTLMGIAFPLIGAIGFFAHPEELFFNYFFMATIAALGAFSEWVVLGFLVSISACIATLIVGLLYPSMGIPGNWLALTSGCLGIMTLYAMSSARRSFREQEKLEGIAMVAQAMIQKNPDEEGPLNRLVLETARFLEQGSQERNAYPIENLSISECLQEALALYPFEESVRPYAKLKVESEFSVKANSQLLINCFLHLIDNAAYYLHRGEAQTLVCRVDGKKRKIYFEDDGPGVPTRNIPYIFELFFGAGKLSSGLGLTYCRKAFKSMGASIHLTSEPGECLTEFTASFPKTNLRI